MTMPPMSGSGPFDYGDDTVSARLSVDVPQDAQANLTQLVTHAHDLRVHMEAAARAQGDFITYLRELPQVMGQSQQAANGFFSSANGLMGSMGPGPLRGGQGQNDARHPDPTGQPGSGAGRMEQQLETLRNNDLRQYANLMAQNGERTIRRGEDPQLEPRREGGGGGGGTGPGRGAGGSPGPGATPGGGGTGPGSGSGPGRPASEESSQDWADRFQQMQQSGTAWINRVASQTGAGGNIGGLELMNSGIHGASGMIQNQQRRLQEQIAQAEARARQEAESQGMDEAGTAAHVASATGQLRGLSGTLGGAARFAGVAGAAVGVGMGVQKAGEWYQGMRAQGSVRGGGAKEGMEFEMGVRTMAMNPFLNVEQSRKIMTTALSEGHTGKEFETVTEFMAENLKKMNMDVAESVKVLRNNVAKGGQSVAGAQMDVEAVSRMARDPNSRLTSPQLRNEYNQSMDTMMGGIAPPSGQEASQMSLLMAPLMSQDPNLKGNLDDILMPAASNPAMARIIAPGYSGTPEAALAFALGKEGGDEKVMRALVGQIVKAGKDQLTVRLMSNENTVGAGLNRFKGMLRGVGVNVPDNLVSPLLKTAMDGTLEKEVDRVIALRKKEQTGDKPKKKGIMDRIGNGIKSAIVNPLNFAGSKAAEGLGMAAGELHIPGAGSLEEWGSENADEQWAEMKENYALAGGAYTNERISEVMDTYGSDAKIKDAKGKEHSLNRDALRNEQMMKDLVEGKAQIKIPGGEYSTLENLSAQETAKDGTKGSGGGAFDLTERAAQLLVLIPSGNTLNQTQLNSNEGQGPGRNTPQPGEAYDPPAPGGN